jgi:hypothetical protein
MSIDNLTLTFPFSPFCVAYELEMSYYNIAVNCFGGYLFLMCDLFCLCCVLGMVREVNWELNGEMCMCVRSTVPVKSGG